MGRDLGQQRDSDTGVRNLAVVLCILPSALMNIWPRAVEAVASGKVDASTAAIVVLQSVAVATMAAVPFAFEKSRNWLLKLFCLAFGAALFSVNLFNAIEVTGHVRETVTAGSSGKLATAAALNTRLDALSKSRNEVPQHAFTSPAGLSAAESAVRSAEAARDAECRYIGTKCRERQNDVTTAQAALAKAAENRELTERADKLDADIRAAEKELADLGPLPAHADAAAAKVAAVFGLSEIWVHENWPTWLAIVVELLALLGPVTWVEALRAPARQHRPIGLPVAETQRPAPVAAVAPPPVMAALAPTPASPAPAKKSRPTRAAAVTNAADARDWHNSRILARPGNLVRVRDAYEAYCAWCGDRKATPISLTAFGTLMKGELGVAYVEKSKRGFYVDVALAGEHAPLRLVVNG